MTDIDGPNICRTLLRRAGRGDAAAFAELYDRTSPGVFGLVRSILTDVGLAEDITREVYLHIWRTASHYDPDRGDPSTLLMTMARRYALDRVRTSPSRDGASGQPPPAVSGEDVADLVERWAGAHLSAAAPVTSREVLVLIYFRGQTLGEVAEELGITEATAISRLNDALSSLRDHSVSAPPQPRKTSRSRPREDAR